jgi:hypothetical protein
MGHNDEAHLHWYLAKGKIFYTYRSFINSGYYRWFRNLGPQTPRTADREFLEVSATGDDMIETTIIFALGILALGFDRQVANAMYQFSGGFGELCRQHKVWGTISRPLDPLTSYRNILLFARFWACFVLLLGICLFLLAS